MVLTAMVLTVEMVVMITFLFSHAHCRALPSTPATVAVKMVEIPPSLTAVVELSAIELLRAGDGDGADGDGADGGEGGDGGDLPALQRALTSTAKHPGHGRGEDGGDPPLPDGCRRAHGCGA